MYSLNDVLALRDVEEYIETQHVHLMTFLPLHSMTELNE